MSGTLRRQLLSGWPVDAGNSTKRRTRAAPRTSLDALEALVQSKAWNEVDEIRAENFHRWRKEHESVGGVDADSGSATDLYDAEGKRVGRSTGGHSRRHTISDGLTERTTTAAGEGIRAVAIALDTVLTDVLNVLPQIADGFTLELTDTGYRTSRQMRPKPT